MPYREPNICDSWLEMNCLSSKYLRNIESVDNSVMDLSLVSAANPKEIRFAISISNTLILPIQVANFVSLNSPSRKLSSIYLIRDGTSGVVNFLPQISMTLSRSIFISGFTSFKSLSRCFNRARFIFSFN